MIKMKIRTIKLILPLIVLALFGRQQVSAADSLVLSVTPPLFQISPAKGDTWSSYVKVSNTNAYDLKLYVRVMDFLPEGDGVNGKFMPVVSGDDSASTLARWVTITADPVSVPKGKSVEVPFSVHVPMDASPGDYYAAVVIGTQPPEGAPRSGSPITLSSSVASLIVARIKGQLTDTAIVREFRSDREFYGRPDVNFVLRFENRGNAHLRPEGAIAVYNMWGSKVADVPVNSGPDAVSVSPHSIRQFNINWQGKNDIWNMGFYRAVLSLGYGPDDKQTLSGTTGFLFVPPKQFSLFVGILLICAALVMFGIKRRIATAAAVRRKK